MSKLLEALRVSLDYFVSVPT